MVILAAVSGERHQDRVVEVGYDLATAYGDDLAVLHVMDEEQFDELRGRDEVSTPIAVPGVDEERGPVYIPAGRNLSDYNLEDATADAEDVARECIEGTLTSDRQATVTVHGRVGDPATEIVNEADRIDARYVVVGGRKRSPAGKAIFGSVAQSTILNADRPTVTITSTEQ